jgi:hypothetical protein
MSNRYISNVSQQYVPLRVIQNEDRDGLTVLQVSRQLAVKEQSTDFYQDLIKLTIINKPIKEKSELIEEKSERIKVAQQYLAYFQRELQKVDNPKDLNKSNHRSSSKPLDEDEISNDEDEISNLVSSEKIRHRNYSEHRSEIKDNLIDQSDEIKTVFSDQIETVFTGDLRVLCDPDSTIIKFRHEYKKIPIHNSFTTVEIDRDYVPLGFSSTPPIFSAHDLSMSETPNKKILDALEVVREETGRESIDPEWKDNCLLKWYFDKNNKQWQLVYIVEHVVDDACNNTITFFPDIVDYIINANSGEFITKIYRTQ